MRDTPHIAQYLFEIVSQRGYRTFVPCFHVVSRKYRWHTPFVKGGHHTSTPHALQGGNALKRGRGHRTQLAMLRHQKWGNPKQPMKLQQPRNYDFWMFQFNLLGSQGGNSREMTTSPLDHYWEVAVALTTAAKLQKVRANSREMTSQKLNEEHETWRRFMAACCRFKCL